MELARVDHQLGLDAEAAQRLIHLLAAEQRHVEILLAAHEQRRRLDPVGVEERIRHLHPQVLRSSTAGRAPCSYCWMYMSVPYIEIWFELPAPLIAALKRRSVAIV